MASGSGHINRSNTTNSGSSSTNVNSHWNFNSGAKEEIDTKSHNGAIFSNNLVMQDRHSGKDPDISYKSKRKVLSQNTDSSFSQDNIELEAAGNSEVLELPLESRHASHHATGPMYPRTKFTASTASAQHNTSQGARQKITYIKEETKAEEDRNNIVNSHANTKKQPIWQRNRNSSQSSNKEVKINSVSQANKENSHPDANQILSRLMQIQDYIKQVTVMMENLKKSGDQRVLGRIKKLHKVHADLKDSEKQLLELLNKLSFTQPEIKSGTENVSDVDSDADGTDSVSVNLDTKSETSETDLNPQNDSNEAESLSRRNELIKKVIESQEKLKALQDQQSVLLALQHKAENRLTEAKAYRNKIMASLDNEDVPSPVQIQTTASVVLQDDLENLQQRLNALKDLYDNRQRAQSLSRSFDSESKMVDESDGFDELQQHELQDKLRDLQDKKRYMDDLLQELKSMQQKHNSQLNNNDQSANEVQNEPSNLSASAKETLENAQELLHSLDSPQKLRKIEDMKSRLQQLQDIVSVYQAAAPESVLSQSSNSVNSQPVACQDDEKKNYPARKSNKVKKTRNQKKDNISREFSNEYLARNLKENQASIQDDTVGEGSDENVLTQNWNSDFQLNDKANKLQTTRDKLRKLQELLAVVQETQASGERINIDFANELLVSIDEGKSASNEIEEQGIAGVRRVRCQEMNSEEDPNHNDNARSLMYEEGMDDQKSELESILEERNKLLMMQDHIMKLQQEFPVNNSAETQTRAAKASGVQKKTSLPIGNKEKSKSSVSESPLKSNQVVNQAKQTSTPNSNRLQCPNRNKTAQAMHVDAGNNESEIVVSNQEIWTEMRQRLIMREELKQKRRELEELMRKDKGKSNSRNQDISDNISYSNKSEALGMSYVGTEGTTAATWGGSTQENPDDQEDHNESQEEIDDLEDNEGYSSEEMIPLEEEECHISNENHENSFPADSDFRKLERNRHRSESHPSIENTMANNIGRISKSKSDPKDGRNLWVKSPPTRGSNHSWNSHNISQNRHARPSEEAIPEREPEQAAGSTHEIPHSLWQQQAIQLQQQLEQTNFLCQSIIRDQNNLAGFLHHCNHLNTSAGSSPAEVLRPVVPELLQHYSQQLQQQQLLINLNQCYHLLYLQQTEIHQLQHQLQQVLHANSSGHSLASEEVPRRNPTNVGLPTEDFEFHPMSANQWFSQLSASPFPRFSPVPPNSRNVETSNAFVPSATVPLQTNNPPFPTCLNGQQELNRGTETLNNQVPPGTRANNYWDNFRSYSRQNLLSAASANKSNDSGANSSFNSHQLHSVPLLQNRHLLHPERTAHSMDSLHQGVGHNSSAVNVQSHPPNEHSRASFRQIDASTQVVPKLDLQELLTKARRTKDKNKDHPQAGCAASETRGASNYHPSHESQNTATMPLLGNFQGIDYEGQMNRFFSTLPNAVGLYPFLHPRQVYRESDAPNDHSLFESMRESIYTEVAALISQNEGRPQFLIQLFRELQLLISDYLRQNALIAIQELICQQMSNNSSPHPTRKHEKQQAGSEWLEAPVNTASEHTASESFITSDEEEVRAQLFKMTKAPRGLDVASSKRTSERQHFEYSEQVETGERVTTPPASSEHPFASDSMAETVVNVNKIKETNQQKLPFTAAFGQHSPSHSGLKRCSVSEGASSSAQDQGSETSTSDIPYSGLNTNQLDDQIQAIMLEVIPFLKAHLDDVCSPKLLAYIQQLTLSLVTQRDEAMELTQFFQKQLSRILQDTLAKYVGKRLRECGEDLLVDMSEVLFNELAFLRLVQNMDNGGIRSKTRNFHSIMQNQDTNWNMSSSEGTPPTEGLKSKVDISKKGSASQNIAAGASGDVEATDADMALIISRLEEDDLGQARDDAMAANCDIMEREDINRVCAGQSKSFVNQLERKTDSRNEDMSGIVGCEGEDQGNRGVVSEENDESVYGEADGETEGEGLEDNQDLAEADQSQSHPALERIAVLQNQPIAVVPSSFENGIPAENKINRIEATEDDQVQGTESLGAIGGIVLNGESSGAEGTELEQGLDEVPTKLRPLFQDEMSHPTLEEAVLKTAAQENLDESAEAELIETSSSFLASGEIKHK